MIEFRNGDCSLLFHRKDNLFEIWMTKCGEMRRTDYKSIGQMMNELKGVYDFTDDMVFDLIHTANVVD